MKTARKKALPILALLIILACGCQTRRYSAFQEVAGQRVEEHANEAEEWRVITVTRVDTVRGVDTVTVREVDTVTVTRRLTRSVVVTDTVRVVVTDTVTEQNEATAAKQNEVAAVAKKSKQGNILIAIIVCFFASFCLFFIEKVLKKLIR